MSITEVVLHNWNAAAERMDFRPSSRILRKLGHEVGQILDHISQLDILDEHRLKEEITKARAALWRANGFRMRVSNSARSKAVAVLAIACDRELGIRPSSNQIMAALAMHDGYVVQLDPGDRKAAAIALSAILHVWGGSSCHIVTASDYLAERDALLMKPLFAKCGCSVAALVQGIPADESAQFYSLDILYATGRQLLSDFMRDHMLLSGVSGSLRRRLWERRTPEGARRPLMKGTFVAIVDDAGTVLLDDATSPLVISASGKESVLEEATLIARTLVAQLEPGRDYVLNREPPLIFQFTPDGKHRLAALSADLPAFWRLEKRCQDIFFLAILARDVLQRDKHYVVQQERVAILDESIHKLMAGQSWHFGVIQAIEAKEGLTFTVPPRTIARTVFQEFFPRYHKLSGSDYVLSDVRHELRRTYGLRLLRLPSRFPEHLKIIPRYNFANREDKMAALLEEVVQLQSRHFPVLVGTRFMRDAHDIAENLRELRIECAVLDGNDPGADAQLLSLAGSAGRVTVVNGMAGRGSNIAVPGEIESQGGLQLLLFEHHLSKRADRLFFAFAEGTGAPGKIQVFASPEDDLFARSLSIWIKPLSWLATWPKLRARSMAAQVYLSQRSSHWQASRHRQLLLNREEQLDQQLAFFRKS